VHGAAQAWQSAEHSVRSQIERFRVFLESDRRSVRQFRLEHPDTMMVLFSGVAAIVLGVLVAALAAVAISITPKVKEQARTKMKDWFG